MLSKLEIEMRNRLRFELNKKMFDIWNLYRSVQDMSLTSQNMIDYIIPLLEKMNILMMDKINRTDHTIDVQQQLCETVFECIVLYEHDCTEELNVKYKETIVDLCLFHIERLCKRGKGIEIEMQDEDM